MRKEAQRNRRVLRKVAIKGKKQVDVDDQELKDIAKKMGGVSPRAFLRAKDAPAAGIDADASDEAVFEAMAENPKLIQRPIGIKGKKAVLGRPPEDLLKLV